MESSKKIIIAGAGLVGSLAAIALKKRGHEVTLFEARSDMRKLKSAGKSINLILTIKGIEPLKRVGLLEEVLKITTPVYGRMMHSLAGELTYQPYGVDESEKNYSVSRKELNILMLNLCEREGIQIHFDSPLESIDHEKKTARFLNLELQTFDHFIGCDGAGSKTRSELQKIVQGENKTIPLGSSYKELLMPAIAGEYQIDKKALHIWPRGNHFLMALPNLDGSFTMTIYMPDEWMRDLDTNEKVQEYFSTYYPDVLEHMPDYTQEFLENPQGFLGSLDTYPWVFEDKMILMGDAAHAICPFFGQGMNCGFSDVEFLLKQLDLNPNDWSESFKNYQDHQKPNGDAIRDMSLENFIEMSERVGDEDFLFRKKVENKIEIAFPDLYRSRYAQVVYTLTPYHKAKKNGDVNQKILDDICAVTKTIEELDLENAKEIILKYKE